MAEAGEGVGDRASRFLLVAITALFVVAPSAVAGPADAELAITVRVGGDKAYLRPFHDGGTNQVPVQVEIVCTRYSAIMATEAVDFEIEVLIHSNAGPLEFDFPGDWARPFAPEFCVEQTVITHDFIVEIVVPWDYPALETISVEVTVDAQDGWGSGRGQWNTSVAFSGTMRPQTNLFVQVPKNSSVANFTVEIWNLGNAPIEASVVPAPAMHDGLLFHRGEMGPAEPFGMAERSFALTLDEKIRGKPGEYQASLVVRAWPVGFPEEVIGTQTLTFPVSVMSDDGATVEAVGVHPLILLFVAVTWVAVSRRWMRT